MLQQSDAFRPMSEGEGQQERFSIRLGASVLRFGGNDDAKVVSLGTPKPELIFTTETVARS